MQEHKGGKSGELSLARRYPGGTEYLSILRTVSRCRPNTRSKQYMSMIRSYIPPVITT